MYIKSTEYFLVLKCRHTFRQLICVFFFFLFFFAEWSKSSDFTQVDSIGKSQNRKTVKIQESSPETVMWQKMFSSEHTVEIYSLQLNSLHCDSLMHSIHQGTYHFDFKLFHLCISNGKQITTESHLSDACWKRFRRFRGEPTCWSASTSLTQLSKELVIFKLGAH